MTDLFQYGFIVRAFLAGSMIAVIAPLIGSFLVVRRFSLIADTLSHIALSGVAIGLILNTQPLPVTIIVTILASLAVEKLRTGNRIPGEAVLAMLLPGGLALSIVLMSLSNGFNTGLFSYLFGSIATVTPTDIGMTLGLGIVTVCTVMLFYRQLLFTSFDEETARASGIRVQSINTLLMVLTAITVSLSMRVVGVLLIGALMVIPVISGMQLAKSFRQSMVFSIILALISVIIGLVLSYYFNLPAGGTIVLLALGIFLVTSLLKKPS